MLSENLEIKATDEHAELHASSNTRRSKTVLVAGHFVDVRSFTASPARSLLLLLSRPGMDAKPGANHDQFTLDLRDVQTKFTPFQVYFTFLQSLKCILQGRKGAKTTIKIHFLHRQLRHRAKNLSRESNRAKQYRNVLGIKKFQRKS